MLHEIDLQPNIDPLISWYKTVKRPLPWRGTADPYRIWISEIMLQQTRIEAVIPYYDRFLHTLPNIAALSACEDDKLMKLWEGLGYYSRARNLKKAAVTMMEKHGGAMPETYDEILALPGIGPYTAGAIASIAFDLPYPAVDGNVLRIIARVSDDNTDVLSAKMKKDVTEMLRGVMDSPRFSPGVFNQALMELGERVCLPNTAPACDACPWKENCLALARGTTESLPVRIKKTIRRVEKRTILIIVDGERIILHKRPNKGLLAGLYEPLNLPGTLGESQIIEEARRLGLDPLQVERLPDATHLFSHIEWQMCGYLVKVADASDFKEEEGCFFVEKTELKNDYSIPGAYAKFMGQI